MGTNLRVFCTGDCHGSFNKIKHLCETENTSINDYLVILGDVGVNYFLNGLDIRSKNFLSTLPITLICIHGNHEERAWNIDTYKKVYNEELKCYVYVEEEYPNILFPENGALFLKDKRCLCVGGAYSVDKHYRLAMGQKWFPDEQLNNEEKKEILEKIKGDNSFYFIFSHTCPLKYEKDLEYLFLSWLDQSTIDKSMEEFLDKVEDSINYQHWFFGHFHDTNELNEKVTILYNDIIELDL